jgi:hypothetical protein
VNKEKRGPDLAAGTPSSSHLLNWLVRKSVPLVSGSWITFGVFSRFRSDFTDLLAKSLVEPTMSKRDAVKGGE